MQLVWNPAIVFLMPHTSVVVKHSISHARVSEIAVWLGESTRADLWRKFDAPFVPELVSWGEKNK